MSVKSEMQLLPLRDDESSSEGFSLHVYSDANVTLVSEPTMLPFVARVGHPVWLGVIPIYQR